MKVKDLLEQLNYYNDINPNMEIIISRDSEGNGYSPLCQVDDAYYVPNSKYSGEVYYEYNLQEEPEEYGDYADEIRSNPLALILYPNN